MECSFLVPEIWDRFSVSYIFHPAPMLLLYQVSRGHLYGGGDHDYVTSYSCQGASVGENTLFARARKADSEQRAGNRRNGGSCLLRRCKDT